MANLSALTVSAAIELALFAAVLFLVFGLDDLMIDALRLAGIGRPDPRPCVRDGPVHRRYAVFVPAWQESATIGAMLDHLVRRWPSQQLRIYVGIYPNDLATMLAAAHAAAGDTRLRVVINDEDGPTTKGHCLNRLWRAAAADVAAKHFLPDAVILHDAEDIVDAGELAVFDDALASADYVQLPVVPVADRVGRWIGGHYCDEFAESHQKDVPVRSAIGAPMPMAGVGCAIAYRVLDAVAGRVGPFPADSMTEDYELGVRLGLAGYRGRFVARRGLEGRLVATRSCFPDRIDFAVRQKTRWMQGIALDGWDRIGWPIARGAGSAAQLINWWMLWRDRRAALAAVAICAGYAALLLMLAAQILWADAVERAIGDHPALLNLTLINLGLLVWRAMVRMACTHRYYGWPQAGLALLRMPIANIVLIMTARRAIWRYWRRRRGGPLHWDKTVHRLPPVPTLEGAKG